MIGDGAARQRRYSPGMLQDLLRRLAGPPQRGALAPEDARLAMAALMVRISRTDEHYADAERHRHRYEVDLAYRDKLESCGLRFSGLSPDGRLPEIVEIPGHPWFIGVQFHPELKSKPFAPHPLFADFVRAAKEQSRLV